MAQVAGTGHLVRIFYDQNDNARHREMLLYREIGQRIRDMQMGPDGKTYLLTEQDDGALLRIDPVVQ